MFQKIKTISIQYKQTLLFALLGIISGIIPSALNHINEFWRWSLPAKMASEYGFWIIFVTLIILRSKSRKLAALNTFTFCFVMVIVYGLAETIYKIPNLLSGIYSEGTTFLSLFLEYELSQPQWFIVITLLIPISLLIYNYSNHKGRIFTNVATNVLIILPLLLSITRIISSLSKKVIVCADISRGWIAGDCTFQQPDAWIVSNRVAEVAIYTAFIVAWAIYSYSLFQKRHNYVK